jgi:hypothetical protein
MVRSGVANVVVTGLVAAFAAFFVFGADAAVFVVLLASAAGAYLGWRPRSGYGRAGGVLLAIVNALVILVLNFFLWLAFGLVACGGDGGTQYSAPGSQRAAYCDVLGNHGVLQVLAVFGAALLVLAVGLRAARLRDSRLALVGLFAGIVLTIAMHLPGWLLSASA